VSTSHTSVVICAYTQARWDQLTAAIDSAVGQPGASEVVVVIDHEPGLLARVLDRWPDLAVLPNRYRRGLSGARNTGLDYATGDIIAFLDDDAVAKPGWLAELVDCFQEVDIVAAGGRAIPSWPRGTAPAMLPPELLWVVGCSYRGQPAERADVRNVIGCSMAFRTAALRAIGGFNVATGRVGQVPLGAEETEVCIRLKRADAAARIVLEPASEVLHSVSIDRVTWRYLRRRSFYEGVSKAVLSKSLGAADALESERNYATYVLPSGVFRAVRRGEPASAAAIIVSLVAAAAGYAYGSVRPRAAQVPPATMKFPALQ
jgi:GT2 family glycosyltransferase